MRRRAFLAGIGSAAAAALGSALPKPAISQGLREWRMVTSWPKGLPGLGTGAQRLAENVTALSNGRIVVRLFAAGELVPALQVFDAVADGTADLGHDASYYHVGKKVATGFFTSFPWGLTAPELNGWIYYGGGQELWDELYAPFGLKGMLAGNTGTQMMGWFRRPINTLQDVQGLKFRAPGIGGMVFSKLGANVISLPGGEVFQALQSGVIDGAEWIGPYNDLSFGFYQVAKYYYTPGYHEPGSGLELIINRRTYERLDSDLKLVIQQAARAANVDIYAEFTAKSGPALRSLVEDHGVHVKSVPKDIAIALGYATDELLSEISEHDNISRRIVNSYLSYRDQVIPWSRIGEQHFMNTRRFPFPHGQSLR